MKSQTVSKSKQDDLNASTMLFYLIFCLLCLLFLITLYDWLNTSGRLIRKIPGPKSWPLIGNSLCFLVPPEKLFVTMRSLMKEYGNIYQIHAINNRMIHTSNPDDFETLLHSNQHISKGDIFKFAAPWLGDGLLLSNGEKWHQRRKMLSKAFHFNILKKFMVTFEEETKEFMKCVEPETVNKQSDVHDLLNPAALHIICETALGSSLREDKSAFNQYFKSIQIMGDCIISRAFNMWLHNDNVFNLTEMAKRQKEVLLHLHGFRNKMIENRIKMLGDGKEFKQVDDELTPNYTSNKMAFLDLLLQYEKNGTIDKEGIGEEVDNFMFAGHDTTSTAMSFFLMAIANEPAIQEKIYAELHQILKDAEHFPSMEELNEMKYLERCIKESLRLYPSVPIIVRQVLKETMLSGFKIQTGTICFLHIYDVHRRADLYPDPERFNPDRFLPENILQRHNYSFVPFSAGPRNCIGQKYAMLEMKTLLAGLLRKFRLEPVTRPADIVYKSYMLLQTRDPVYVKFSLR